jgi:hypothetical protein
LDRGDDVTEPAGPCSFERRDQSTVTLDSPGGRLRIEPIEVSEELVIDIEQCVVTRREVTTSFQSEGFGTSGPVERLRGWCAPVDNHGVLRSIPDTDPADVQRVTEHFVVIDPPKDEGRVADVQLIQAVDDVFRERLTLETSLVCTTCTDLEIRGKPARELARVFYTRIGVVQVLLLRCKIGINDDAPRISACRERQIGGLSMISDGCRNPIGPPSAPNTL